jgi:hypothetical protein
MVLRFSKKTTETLVGGTGVSKATSSSSTERPQARPPNGLQNFYHIFLERISMASQIFKSSWTKSPSSENHRQHNLAFACFITTYLGSTSRQRRRGGGGGGRGKGGYLVLYRRGRGWSWGGTGGGFVGWNKERKKRQAWRQKGGQTCIEWVNKKANFVRIFILGYVEKGKAFTPQLPPSLCLSLSLST